MRFTIQWEYQGRTCTVHTDSQINADLVCGAVSERFQCRAVVHTDGGEQGAVTVATFDKGLRI